MKITQLRLVGTENVDLPIKNASPSDIFVLKGSDGLGPPDTDDRQIVLRIGLNPQWGAGQTPDDLRSMLYALLSPPDGDPIEVQLMDGNVVQAATEGEISKFEINPFSNVPEVQLTIDCERRRFFTSPTWTMFTPALKTGLVVTNQGNAPTGFIMRLIVTANTDLITINNDLTHERMILDHDFLVDDIIDISTVDGDRYIRLIRDATQTDILWALRNGGSTWLTLRGGDNVFTVTPTTFSWGQWAYFAKFWGI